MNGGQSHQFAVLRVLITLRNERNDNRGVGHTLGHGIEDIDLHTTIDVHPALYTLGLQLPAGSDHSRLRIPDEQRQDYQLYLTTVASARREWHF